MEKPLADDNVLKFPEYVDQARRKTFFLYLNASGHQKQLSGSRAGEQSHTGPGLTGAEPSWYQPNYYRTVAIVQPAGKTGRNL